VRPPTHYSACFKQEFTAPCSGDSPSIGSSPITDLAGSFTCRRWRHAAVMRSRASSDAFACRRWQQSMKFVGARKAHGEELPRLRGGSEERCRRRFAAARRVIGSCCPEFYGEPPVEALEFDVEGVKPQLHQAVLPKSSTWSVENLTRGAGPHFRKRFFSAFAGAEH